MNHVEIFSFCVKVTHFKIFQKIVFYDKGGLKIPIMCIFFLKNSVQREISGILITHIIKIGNASYSVYLKLSIAQTLHIICLHLKRLNNTFACI